VIDFLRAPILAPATPTEAVPSVTPVGVLPVETNDPAPTETLVPEPTATATVPPTPTLPPVVEVTSTPENTPIPAPTQIGGGMGQIAFASSRSGIPQIYIMNIDMTGLSLLTNMEEGACQPSWSPDGRQIVFISPCRVRGDFTESTYRDSSLYVMNADGTNPKPLTTVPGSDFEPAWSPDGKHIAFTSLRDGKKDIYLLTVDNGAIVRLTTVNGEVQENSQPSWSPFGNQIVYVVKRFNAYQIWVMNDAGEGNVQVARSGQRYSDFLPVWMPDGETIVFNQKDAGIVSRPWLMSIRYEDRESKDPARLDFPKPIEDIEFSPDGLWILFEGLDNTDGNRDIYYMTVSGGNRTRLTIDPAVDFDPTWRPTP
jgi:Tol biopolymer transport system component